MEPTFRNGIRVEPDEGYNGWTNYPTWAVKLWIDNDEGSYNYWREQAQAFVSADIPNTRVGHLADQLKDEHGANGTTASVYDDLLGYSLDRVNWHEIAESLVSEASE